MSETPDVVIVGGGIVGLSTALAAAERGARVIVLEQGKPGRESSWAGAGIIYAWAPSHAKNGFDWLMARGAELHVSTARRLLETTGIDTEFRRSGEILVAKAEASELDQELNALNSHGSAARRITMEQARALEPELSSALRGAVEVPEVARFRPPRHLRALELACARAKVRLISDDAVRSIASKDGQVIGVRTETALYTGDHVVLAAGAWTSGLLAGLGLNVPIRPLRGQIALLKTQAPILRRVISTGYEYLVPRDDGRVLVGSTREDVGFDKRTTASAIRGLLASAALMAPALDGADVEMTWSGLRPATPDGMPILGAIPGHAGLWIAAGHTRYGLHLGPVTGEVLTELMISGRTEADLSMLSPTRFW